jgi:hypothetical protein
MPKLTNVTPLLRPQSQLGSSGAPDTWQTVDAGDVAARGAEGEGGGVYGKVVREVMGHHRPGAPPVVRLHLREGEGASPAGNTIPELLLDRREPADEKALQTLRAFFSSCKLSKVEETAWYTKWEQT